MVVLKDHKPQIGAGRGPQKIDFEKFEKIYSRSTLLVSGYLFIRLMLKSILLLFNDSLNKKGIDYLSINSVMFILVQIRSSYK